MQPVADHKLIMSRIYPGKKGGKSLALELPIRDKAAYYAADPQCRGAYSGDWNSLWGGEEASPYLNQKIHNVDQAIEVVSKFEFPAELRAQANSASRYLANAFENVAKLSVMRDQIEGRIDRHKIPAIMEAVAKQSYRPEEILPFRKVISSPAKKPTLVIVAEASNAHMWDDPAYIPNMLVLTLSILWACQSVGLQTYAGLVQQFHSHLGYEEVLWVDLIAEPNKSLPLTSYACIMHRDLWRMARVVARAADLEGHKLINNLQGITGYEATSPSSCGNFGSANGGNAVHWAKQALNGDLVISIGDIVDKAEADIKLGAKFDVDSAVRDIASQAKKLRKN